MTQYGAGAWTGAPIGGGAGYDNFVPQSAATKFVTTAPEAKTALKNAKSGDVIWVGKRGVTLHIHVKEA